MKTFCPTCAVRCDNATAVDLAEKRVTDIPPTSGCLSVCYYCGQISVFREHSDEPGTLSLEAMSAEEFIELPVAVRSELKHLQQVMKREREKKS